MNAASRSALVIVAFIAGYRAYAQERYLPDAPSQNFVAPKVIAFTNERPHQFLDRQNKVAFATLAGLIAVDAITTQRLISSGRAHEANPVWRPLVHQGWPGEMAASALGFGAALGMSYTLHKTGHHKLERWANWLTVGVEEGTDAHNLLLDVGR